MEYHRLAAASALAGGAQTLLVAANLNHEGDARFARVHGLILSMLGRQTKSEQRFAFLQPADLLPTARPMGR